MKKTNTMEMSVRAKRMTELFHKNVQSYTNQHIEKALFRIRSRLMLKVQIPGKPVDNMKFLVGAKWADKVVSTLKSEGFKANVERNTYIRGKVKQNSVITVWFS